MMNPGTLSGAGLSANSMALAIEQAFVSLGLIDLAEETAEAAEQRRKTFIAISTGVINHLKAQLEVVVATHSLSATVPASNVTLTGPSTIK